MVKITYSKIQKAKISHLIEENVFGVLVGDTFIDITEDLERFIKEKVSINATKTFDDEGKPILFLLSKKDLENIKLK